MQKKRIPIFKLIVYFIVGFILSIVGLIAAGLWIRFKSKDFKKLKFIVLLLGFVCSTSFLVISSLNSGKSAQKTQDSFFSQYPELKIINDGLSKQYPDATISFRFDTTNSTQVQLINPSNTKTSTYTTLFVTFQSEKGLTAQQINVVGKYVCQKLVQENKMYGVIKITDNKTIKLLNLIPISSYYSIDGTCNDFNMP